MPPSIGVRHRDSSDLDPDVPVLAPIEHTQDLHGASPGHLAIELRMTKGRLDPALVCADECLSRIAHRRRSQYVGEVGRRQLTIVEAADDDGVRDGSLTSARSSAKAGLLRLLEWRTRRGRPSTKAAPERRCNKTHDSLHRKVGLPQ